MKTFTYFDPYAESALVLDHLSDEQRLRYFGTADDAEAARQLLAERGNTFVVPGGAARTGRLAAGLVTLGLFTGGAGAVLGYLAVQEGDLTLVGTGLLLVVLGLGAAWVGWRIPGWERRRDARDAAEFRALAWRAPRDAR